MIDQAIAVIDQVVSVIDVPQVVSAIDLAVCALVGFVGFFSSYGVWQAAIERRIVREGPPKRSARRDPERTAHRRTSHVSRRRAQRQPLLTS